MRGLDSFRCVRRKQKTKKRIRTQEHARMPLHQHVFVLCSRTKGILVRRNRPICGESRGHATDSMNLTWLSIARIRKFLSGLGPRSTTNRDSLPRNRRFARPSGQMERTFPILHGFYRVFRSVGASGRMPRKKASGETQESANIA